MIGSEAHISNKIAYSSDIDISFCCKGKPFKLKFKNTGEKYLFDTITKALAGYSIQDEIPAYIDVEQAVVGDKYQTCLRRNVSLTGVVYGDAVDAERGKNGVLQLSAILTFEDKQPLTNIQNPRIVIKTKSGMILSTIGGETNQASIISMWEMITEDTDATIDWKMIFSNGGAA